MPDSRWESFLGPADEWIIAYAALPFYSLTSVRLFAIGHALELYLKAAVAKQHGDYGPAIARRHRLDLLLADCSFFLPTYQLIPSVLTQVPFTGEAFPNLEPAELEHYSQNQELYLVASNLADWKYFGAPRKKPGAIAFAYLFPNDYWIKLFNSIREFLRYPEPDRSDPISRLLDEGILPPQPQHFLSQLYIATSEGGTMKLRCQGGALDGQTVEVPNDVTKGKTLSVTGMVGGKPLQAKYEVASDGNERWLVPYPKN